MKKFICTRTWRDLTDKHLYHEGDPFPFDGREVPEERLRELESGRNRAGLKMIQGIITEDAPKAAKKPEAQAEQKTGKPDELKTVRKAPARKATKK